MKKSIKIFTDSLDVLETLTDEQAGQLFKAIKAYEVNKEEVLDGLMKAIFVPFKNNIERADEAYTKVVEANKANGLKGGRPNRNKANGLKPNPNNPKKDKDKDKDKDKEYIAPILSFLNETLNTKYRTAIKTKTLILARVSEGFTIDDFKYVIKVKSEEWGTDEKMKKFLRPETLFGTKFESYLHQEKKKKIDKPATCGKEQLGGVIW